METRVFMNWYAYAALATTVLSYVAYFTDTLEGAVIAAPLVFLIKTALLVAAFRSSVKMDTYGQIVTWLMVFLTVPTFLLALIVIASPFISFT